MRARSASSGRSRRSASTASSPANGTFGTSLREFVDHYRAEQNHQGIGNELIEQPPNRRTGGPVRRRQRVGGILNYYYLGSVNTARLSVGQFYEAALSSYLVGRSSTGLYRQTSSERAQPSHPAKEGWARERATRRQPRRKGSF